MNNATPSTVQTASFYAHFEDMVDAYVGPFATQGECDAHAHFCRQRGDSSVYHGAVTTLPAGAFVLTPSASTAFAG